MRRFTRKLKIGTKFIGGSSSVLVQSMTKTKTHDIQATVNQILQLEKSGCDIIRIAVPDEVAVRALTSIKQQTHIPIVADIHFDHRLALLSIDAGADKIRINPGNIGDRNNFKQILNRAYEANIPIRIGVNSGSIEKEILKKYGKICAEALVQSAIKYIRFCEDSHFDKLIISLKSSDVNTMIEANKIFAEQSDYPLHLGITAAGPFRNGLIKSSIGIGTLLCQGIGDTIRVSLTGSPLDEVKAGIEILQSLQLRETGLNIVSCPTCSRSQIDLIEIVQNIEKHNYLISKPLTVAIMGCTVNGPGEASDADIGIACGRKNAVLFKMGKIMKTIPKKEIINTILNEIESW